MARSSLFTCVRSRLGLVLRPVGQVHRILPRVPKRCPPVRPPLGQPGTVEQRLAELSEESRTVFLLIWREGFKQRDVAAYLNISRRRVRRVLLRAIAHIAAGSIAEVHPERDRDAHAEDPQADTAMQHTPRP